MRIPVIRHKRTLAAVIALSLVFWLSCYAYLHHEINLLEKLQLEGQTHAQRVAWQAVTTGHRISMQAYFDSYVMQPEVLEILKSSLTGDQEQQNIARVRLFRKLSPVYEQLRQRDVRQLHFHTPDNRSFLRFHSPHNSGDSLVASRPSVVEVNRTRKPVFGFETGRVVIGFRNVLPVIWQGRHLGSVELSQPFEAVRKGLQDLDPSKEYLLVLKGSVLLPKLFEEHKKHYAPSLFSPDWLVEDPQQELPDSAAPLSPEAREVYGMLKGNRAFAAALASGVNASIAIRRGGQVCQVSMIPLRDTDGIPSALMLSFVKSPELAELYVSHRINLLVFTVMTLFGGTALYLFLSSIQKVREQERQMSLITSNIADGIYVMDEKGEITFTNQRASELLGFSRDEFKGRVAHDLFHRHAGSEMTPLEQCPIFNVVRTRGRYEGEEFFAHKDGSLLTTQVASQPMLKGDRVIGSVTVFRDISEQKQLEEQLRLLSITDPLTGVYNRRFLQETLLKELYRAERHGATFCLIMLDLDRFKLVNDRFGHEAGDRVLRHLVELVQGRIRSSDLLARWGGEEFLLLLPNTPLSAGVAVADELLEALRNAEVSGVGIITASFGVCCWHPNDSVESLVQRVDALMYEAKQSGRNCVRSERA